MKNCEAAGFTLISSAGSNAGRDLGGAPGMGVSFLVLSPSHLSSPDMEGTSFQLMSDKFSASLTPITSVNFEYCAELEQFLWLLLKLMMNLWITFASDLHQTMWILPCPPGHISCSICVCLQMEE